MQATTIHDTPALPDFTDLETAFSCKSDSEIKQAYWLFRLMNNPLLMHTVTSASSLALQLHLPVKGLIKSTVYKHFCGGESLKEALEVIEKLDDQHITAVLDYAAEAEQTEEGFEHVFQRILQNISLARKCAGIGAISIKMTGLGHREIFEKLHAGKQLSAAVTSYYQLRYQLTEEDAISYYHTTRRLNTLCEKASQAGVRIYIDAEESWLQAPIDALCEEMMRRYNKKEALIFNTLQMYRTDRLEYLAGLLDKGHRQGFKPGVKLVRGAYWEKERERASKLHYPSPVFPAKSDTDVSFNKATALCIEQLPALELCLATHNQESLQFALQEVEQQGLQQYRHHLHFSQLFGMSDNLTYALAKAGFNTSKYLPFGEVEKALPYLIRRAEENTAVAGQVGRELQLLIGEMRRRKLA